MSAAKISAGLLMFRRPEGVLEFFLVHPGGPFFAKKDAGFWTIPKGLAEQDEDLLTAARREFIEETGFAPVPPFYELGSVRQKSGKLTHAWGFEGDYDPSLLVSNTCEISWPPRSGRTLTVPEVDRGAWFDTEQAYAFCREEQRTLITRLAEVLAREAKQGAREGAAGHSGPAQT